MSIDARRAYDVWLRVIADEGLYAHVIAGTHATLAASHGLQPVDLAVLDQLHAEKGTRWNIENLRFRTALECGGTVQSYLPRTIKLLTGGDDNWLQDISFEYLAFHRWREHGQFRFAECQRFGTYVRERIMKRRMTPPHLDVVLEFELAVVALLARTATVAPDQWPRPVELTDEALSAARLRRGPVVELLELPVDIREWVTSGDPSKGDVHERPVTFLLYVPSLRDLHRIKILGEGPKLVLSSLDDGRTVGAVVAELEAEYELDPVELLAMTRNWLAEGILSVRLA